MFYRDKQQLVITLLALLMLGGFMGFRYAPILHRRSALAEQMKELDKECEQINKYGSLLPELKAQTDTLRSQLELFDQKCPQGRRFSELWQQIADIMNACELSDQLVRPEAEIRSDEICCIPLTIECKGSMDQLYRFFRSIEQIERQLNVQEAVFENTEDFSGPITLKAKVNVYYQPETTDNG